MSRVQCIFTADGMFECAGEEGAGRRPALWGPSPSPSHAWSDEGPSQMAAAESAALRQRPPGAAPVFAASDFPWAPSADASAAEASGRSQEQGRDRSQGQGQGQGQGHEPGPQPHGAKIRVIPPVQ